MIRNGDMIYGYVVLAVANGIALAHSQTAPDPYVVWRIDADGNGVSFGKYTQNHEDAEWDFCAKAFPWFEDNAPINMIEDNAAERIDSFNYHLNEAKERVETCRNVLDEAQQAIDRAAALVEEMVVEFFRQAVDKSGPQEHDTEEILKMLERINEKSLNRHS